MSVKSAKRAAARAVAAAGAAATDKAAAAGPGAAGPGPGSVGPKFLTVQAPVQGDAEMTAMGVVLNLMAWLDKEKPGSSANVAAWAESRWGRKET